MEVCAGFGKRGCRVGSLFGRKTRRGSRNTGRDTLNIYIQTLVEFFLGLAMGETHIASILAIEIPDLCDPRNLRDGKLFFKRKGRDECI